MKVLLFIFIVSIACDVLALNTARGVFKNLKSPGVRNAAARTLNIGAHTPKPAIKPMGKVIPPIRTTNIASDVQKIRELDLLKRGLNISPNAATNIANRVQFAARTAAQSVKPSKIELSQKDLAELAKKLAALPQSTPARKTAILTWGRILNGITFAYAAYALSGEVSDVHQKALEIMAEGHNDDVRSGMEIADDIAKVLSRRTSVTERARVLGGLIKTYKNFKSIYAEKYEEELKTSKEFIEKQRKNLVDLWNGWFEVLGFLKDVGYDISKYRSNIEPELAAEIKNNPFSDKYVATKYAPLY